MDKKLSLYFTKGKYPTFQNGHLCIENKVNNLFDDSHLKGSKASLSAFLIFFLKAAAYGEDFDTSIAILDGGRNSPAHLIYKSLPMVSKVSKLEHLISARCCTSSDKFSYYQTFLKLQGFTIQVYLDFSLSNAIANNLSWSLEYQFYKEYQSSLKVEKWDLI